MTPELYALADDIRLEGHRRVCHSDDPWTPEKSQAHRLWMHPESDDDGGCDEGCCDDYKCRICGHRYRVGASQ